MSRSPWKLLDRAVGDLEDFEALLSRFPDAMARVRAVLGEGGLARIADMRAELRAAVVQLRDGPPPPTSADDA